MFKNGASSRDFMKRGLNEVRNKVYIPILRLYLKSLMDFMGEDLIAVILYGSLARGEANLKKSDIDLYVVAKNWPRYFDQRFGLLSRVFRKVESSSEYKELLEAGFHVSFSEYPLTLEEALKHGPLDLEVYADGIVLFEKDDFIENKFGRLKERLEELGAKRIRTKDGKSYWVLKEKIKFGEIIEI